MNKVKKFYKDMYGEDAPKEFESMKSKTLFNFAEAYSQKQIKLLNLACVTQQRELLIAFCEYVDIEGLGAHPDDVTIDIENFIKKAIYSG